MKITKTSLKTLIREILEEQEEQEAQGAPPQKQTADVAKVAKKMGATSGLGGLMQNINNRIELEGLLKEVIQNLSQKLKPQDIFMGISNVLRQLKGEMKTK